MSEEQQQPVQPEEQQPNAVQQQQEEVGQEKNQTQEEVVSKAEFERVLADMHKYKSQARDMANKSRAEQEAILREKGEWQKIAEMKEQEAKEVSERYSQLQESLVQSKKFEALKEEALKQGIRPEALLDLELVGMDGVQVEQTSLGRVNVLGVGDAINRIKATRPHWFGSGRTTVVGSTPNVNNAPQGVVSNEELIKLSLQAKKSGDYTDYNKAFEKYRQQRKTK